MPPKKRGVSIKTKGSTSPEQKEVAEQAVSREVFKPVKGGAASSESARLDTEKLASFLEGPSSPTYKGGPISETSNGNKVDHKGDVGRSPGSRLVQEPLPPGTKVVTKTERHRVITDEFSNGSPQRPPDPNTTTTSFEAHVRMQMSLPRKAVTSSAGPVESGGVQAAGFQAGGHESCRCRGPSRPRCPDCGNPRSTRDCRGCCSSSTCSDSCSQDDDGEGTASTLASSTCSSCHSDIGTMMHSTASLCQTLARVLSGKSHHCKKS